MLQGRGLALALLPGLALAALTPPGLGCNGRGKDASETAATSETAGETAGSTSVASSTEGGTESGTETATETTGEACPGATPAAIMACVEEPRYVTDLEFIAAVRTPGSPHWQAVQDLCADRLAELGYEVELHDYGTGVNVLGTRQGSSADAERVLVGAHYDHIAGCTGADDNATGVAGVLEIARVLAEVTTPHTLVIACWDEEELGLVGSKAYVAENTAAIAMGTAAPFRAVYAYDMIGVKSDEPDTQTFPMGFDLLFPEEYAKLEANQFRADFLFWVSDDTMEPDGAALAGLAATIGLPVIGASLTDDFKKSDLLADLRRSDHAGFWDADIPAMFLTDTSEFRYPSYHCMDGGDDSLDKLNYGFAAQVVRATAGGVAVSLGL
ncbi:MAG: M20/M25/M40 family metallo-hydrolase [Nannocystaceae bacterium]